MNNYLMLFDFDGTQFDTFKPGPRGIGVREASLMAIKDVLGSEASRVYENSNEIHNFAPTELVRYIRSNGRKGEIESHAQNFYNSYSDQMAEMVPSGKGMDLTWNGDDNLSVMTELFVRQKLNYLSDQVGEKTSEGKKWPIPVRGFTDFWEYLDSVQDESGGRLSITRGIISSGHELFIRKTFNTWQLAQPDILISDDDIRGRKNPPIEIEHEAMRRYKPGLLPMALGHREWLNNRGMTGSNFSLDDVSQTRNNIVYFGDDLKIDGEMAFVSKILFGHFNKDNLSPISFSDTHFTFKDWSEVRCRLKSGLYRLSEGAALKEIFCLDKVGIEAPGRINGESTVQRFSKEM